MNYTLTQIRQTNIKNGFYFFSPETMSFFGDRMTSFAVKKWQGETILYRKPTASVSVFGERKRVGKEYFNAWRFNPENGDLISLDKEATAHFRKQL